MVDNVSASERSRVMRSVPSANTRPEVLVRKLLHRMGYRFRLHADDLPGKPDIVFRTRRKVVFIHGCFWHGHSCERDRRPSTNSDYWSGKARGNRRRDRGVQTDLKRAGWNVFVVWECALRNPEDVLTALKAFLGDPRGPTTPRGPSVRGRSRNAR
jgi:DNA mismatch endonuclease (patch repair protein)